MTNRKNRPNTGSKKKSKKKTSEKEKELLDRITREAEKYGGKIIHIDLQKYDLELDCPPDKEVECAQAIYVILKEFNQVDEKDEEKSII